MRTYGKNWGVEDKDDIFVLSNLVLANLEKGEKFKINNIEYEVTVQTEKTLRLKSNKKVYSFKISMLEDFGKWCCNSGKGYDSAHKILADIEGDLILDKINSNNPLHELTDVGKILLRDPIYDESNRFEQCWKVTKSIFNTVVDDTKEVFHETIDSKFMEEILHYFTLPNVKSEIKRYANGFKGEGKQSKEAFLILEKYMKKEQVTDDEKKFFKNQMVDLLKGVGIVLPLQLIPLPFVSTILLIVVEKTMLSMGIKVLPSSFYIEPELKKESKNG